MRQIFVDVLMEIAAKDDKVIFITGDLGFEFNPIKEKYPNRYFNFGVCEQSMISVAAGLAIQGFKPIVYSITPFLLERPFEQIKIDLDSQNVKVMLVGFADYPHHGPTHAELDWKTIAGMLKNTKCFFPVTAGDAKDMLNKAFEYNGPSIVSLKKAKERAKHYICTGGCKGVSDNPGSCQDANCSKHQHPLTECTCGDSKHGFT